MPHFRPAALLVSVAAALAPAPAAAQPQALPPEQLKKIKAATAYVKVSAGRTGGTGSGFLVRADGKTGWVVTNDHVVTFHGAGKSTIELVFQSGTPDEWVVPAEVAGTDPERDLAVLKFTAKKDLPEPLPLTGPDKVPETMPVYVCGFPFGDSLAAGEKKNPEISIGLASVSSVRSDDTGEVVTVQLNGALNPGNSGGPVVTTDGKLIGVAVRTVRGAGIGEAIPHHMVTDLFRGRVAHIWLYQSRDLAESKQSRLRALVSDPLERVKRVRGFIAPVGKDPKEAAPDEVGKLPGAAALDLAPSEEAPSGVIQAAAALPAGAKHVWVQAEWTDSDGKSHRGRARRVKILATDAEFDEAEAAPAVPGTVAPRGPAPKEAPPDPGVAGLTGPDGKKLPALATRLPRTPSGQTELSDLRSGPDRLHGRTVTVDVLVGGVNATAGGDGASLAAADQAGNPVRELDFLIDAPTAAAVTALKLAGPPVQRVVVRLTGSVKPSPTKAYRTVLVVDEVGLIDVGGKVAARLVFADESAKQFADMAAAPAGWVGSACECRVALSGTTEEVIQTSDGPRTARRLVFQTSGGRPVAVVKVFLTDTLAAEVVAAHKKHGGGVQNAEVWFRPLRVDRATGALVCGASRVKLFAPGWNEVRWEGTGTVTDPAPPPAAEVPATPDAAAPFTPGPVPPPVVADPGPASEAPPPVAPTAPAAAPPAPSAPPSAAGGGNNAFVFLLGAVAAVGLLAVGGGVVWLAMRTRAKPTGRRSSRRDDDDDDERPRQRARRSPGKE